MFAFGVASRFSSLWFLSCNWHANFHSHCPHLPFLLPGVCTLWLAHTLLASCILSCIPWALQVWSFSLAAACWGRPCSGAVGCDWGLEAPGETIPLYLYHNMPNHNYLIDVRQSDTYLDINALFKIFNAMKITFDFCIPQGKTFGQARELFIFSEYLMFSNIFKYNLQLAQ